MSPEYSDTLSTSCDCAIHEKAAVSGRHDHRMHIEEYLFVCIK
ncbi:MAG TPA: hypothetical protein VJ969_10890 [Desulfopila sp.]|nr:hypothetical protein [Desulfopila sp.]